MTLVRWTFHDPVEDVTFTVPMNPKEGGTPPNRKKILYEATTAPDGRAIVYQGQQDPKPIEWSGTILSEAHLDAMNEWTDKSRQIKVTDDLNRESWIIIRDFVPKRQKSWSHPWKHDFTLTAIIVDWP